MKSHRCAAGALGEPIPDETTILNFRPLHERHHRGAGLHARSHPHLEAQGLNLGSIPL